MSKADIKEHIKNNIRIMYIVWWNNWKDNILTDKGTHRLGIAKEELKRCFATLFEFIKEEIEDDEFYKLVHRLDYDLVIIIDALYLKWKEKLLNGNKDDLEELNSQLLTCVLNEFEHIFKDVEDGE